jgi:hypothetical protein
MNYVQFQDWLLERIEDLVLFGVPRSEAEHIMKYVELSAIAAEADARKEHQFMLDLRRLGSTVMAERHGCTPQNMRKRRSKLLKSRNRPLRA